MTDAQTAHGPREGPAPTGRKLAPDLARGAMLLLIAMAYAGVYVGGGFGTDVSAAPAVDQVAVVATTLLLDNRAFPMFAILFGYGLAWMVARQRQRGTSEAEVRRLVRRRALFLLLFGFVHAFLVFPGEILASYGLATLVTGWLLLRGVPTLNRAALVLAGCYVVSIPLVTVGLQVGAEVAGAGATEFVLPGYLTVGDWIARLVGLPFAPLFVAVAYPLLLLVVLGYRAGRAGLLDEPAAHRRLLARIAVAGIAVSVLAAVPSALVAVGVLDPGAVATGLLMALQILTGVVGGAGYAAAFALWSMRLEPAPGALVRGVAAMGKRSLTFYLLNSVLVAVVLHPDLVGVGTLVGPAGGLLVAFGAWVVSLLLAAALERAGRPGPLDALMRRCVHRDAGDRVPRAASG